MPLVRVGYKRLYNSLGCSLQSENPVEIDLTLSEMNPHVYMGLNPTLGISASSGNRYVVLGQNGYFGSMAFGREDVSKTWKLDLLTEICCTKEIEVDASLAAAFHSSDSKAIQEIFRIIELQADTFKENIDLIAGTIGLRFHRQFVIEILAENPIAFKSDGAPTQPYLGNVAEVLENLSMKETGAAVLQSMLQQVAGASKKAQTFGASALRWLLRAWRESDPFSRFMALFIPIEVVLSAVKYDENEIAQQRAFDRQLEGVLRDHGGTDSDTLIAGYKKLRQLVHPPLSARFECLAVEAQIDGWKGDILAFKRFNSMRNSVLHYGGKAIEMDVAVGNDTKPETRSIEDLAERYVLWVLFRSKEPYKTRYRPDRTPDMN